MPDTDKYRRYIARFMTYGFWLVLLGFMTFFFEDYLYKKENPNQHLMQQTETSKNEVVLKRNRYGHYVAPGKINGQPVTFLLDTGATTISIPSGVAKNLNLEPKGSSRVTTANGTITVHNVRLNTVSLGPIQLKNISAHINPFMEGHIILLGMSFMRHLEIVQKGDRLRLNL